MSGPKVVRIITREEVVATCNSHLARLDAAMLEFERFCRARQLASDDDFKALHARKLEIHNLLAGEKFLELQKRVPEEIERMSKERDFRVMKASERAALKASALKRARSLARILLAPGNGLPEDLVADLKAIERGTAEDIDAVNSILSRAYVQKSKLEHRVERGDDLRQVAARLSDATVISQLDDWAKHSAEQENAEDLELLDLISVLALEAGESCAPPLRDRWRALEGERDSRAAKLRRDSLMMDVKESLHVAKRERANRIALDALRAEWATFSKDEAPWPLTADVERAALAETVAAAQQAVDAVRRSLQVQWRRDAVLKELAALGYEVGEGLQTALAKDGKVVLRRAAMPDYGVEVVAPDKGERLAFRAVGFGDAWTVRDKVRDTDAEILWCSDFKRLEETIAMHAGHVTIEKATPAGAESLKIVERTMTDAPAVESARPMVSTRRT